MKYVAQTVLTGDNGNEDMTHDPKTRTDTDQPVIYEIRIKSHLGSQWQDWFDGLTIKLVENGESLLTGPVIDQAALHGLIKRVRDLGVPLISVNRVEHDQSETSDV